MKVSLIVPAAGTGKRMKSEVNKQYLVLRERPLLAHTLEKFHDFSEIHEIIVVAAADEIAYCKTQVIEKYGFSKVKKVVSGGATRQESVCNGLREVSADTDYIVVHDGARPFVKKEVLESFLAELKNEEALVLAVPEKNTIKRVRDFYVKESVAREEIWEIQTPQGFRKELLLGAYEKAKGHLEDFTDDSSIVEATGASVKVIQGDYLNIKVTTPEDLILGEAILEMI